MAEVVAVVVVLKQLQRVVVGDTLTVGEITNRLLHIFFQFGLRDAADGGVPRHHRDVLEVVQLTEYAELGELVYPCDEHEPQVRVKALDGAIEVPHYLPHRGQPLPVVHHVQQRGVIFINDYDRLLAGIFDSRFDKTLKSRVDVIFRDAGIRTPLLLVFG